MSTPIDEYFQLKEEPVKSCLAALRQIILDFDAHITEDWKYRMPFYCYKGKMFCYLWVHRKNGMPYLGTVDGRQIEHPDLVQEGRAKMKIMFVDAGKEIPAKKIKEVLRMAIEMSKYPL